MHEISVQSQIKYCAFIWYHADASMFTDLQRWVSGIGEQLGIAARLMIRKQPDKTTMMEIYELPFSDIARIQGMLADIEAQAAQQNWFSRIESPRRAEIFADFASESIT